MTDAKYSTFVVQNLVQGLIIKGYLSQVKNDPLITMEGQNMNSTQGLNYWMSEPIVLCCLPSWHKAAFPFAAFLLVA